MTDWTHSFVREASITEPFDVYPCPPSLRSVITLIRLEYTVGSFGAPTARLSGRETEDIIETTAGKAFTRFLKALANEPGHAGTSWTAPLEEIGCLLVFVCWEEERIPSTPFTSSETFRQLRPTSALSAFKPYLRSLPEISHIPFLHFNGTHVKEAGIASFEMVTWKIPPDLDPTYHKGPAATFHKLGEALDMMIAHPSSRPSHELLSDARAWISNTPDMKPSATEPSEKTHVSLFAWKSRGAEAKVKDRSFLNGREAYSSQEWETGTFLPMQKQWEDYFAAVQRNWEEKGMQTKSVHLKFHRFP